MARKIDATSKRQQVFSRLSEMAETPRAEAVQTIQDEFGIGLAYAKTLYQHHRSSLKQAGSLVAVYVVRDSKDNKPTDPYISEHFVHHAGSNDATSIDAAVGSYLKEQERKSSVAMSLTGGSASITRVGAKSQAEPAEMIKKGEIVRPRMQVVEAMAQLKRYRLSQRVPAEEVSAVEVSAEEVSAVTASVSVSEGPWKVVEKATGVVVASYPTRSAARLAKKASSQVVQKVS